MRVLYEYLKSRRLAKDDEGSIIVFVMVVFSAMFLVGGTAVDLARHENLRATLQYNLDRAVLAAASLKQSNHPTDIVNDYMSKVVTNQEFTVNVDATVNPNSRTVTASASTTLDTWFLSMAGIDNMPITARSAAAESIPNLEISLVLDVSGSMSGNKLANLKVAAKEFVTTMLDGSLPGEISISIVPFNHNVSANAGIFNALNVLETHDNSRCLEFADMDFRSTAIDPVIPQTHGIFTSLYGDFQNFTAGYETCYTQPWFEILPYADSETELHAKIDSLSANGWTAAHLGLKWGLALVDPKFRSVANDLIASGDVNNQLSGLPVDFSDPDTRKIVVMMSDGANTYEFLFGNTYRGVNSPLWKVVSLNSGITETKYYLESLGRPEVLDLETNTWIPARDFRQVTAGVDGVQVKQKTTWEEAWGNMPANWFDNKTGDKAFNDLVYTSSRSTAKADAVMASSCTAARDGGVVLYTIGYETSDTTSTKLRNCATTAGHYYDAAGTQISDVFSAIARSIQKLKLTQ